ncbi:serine hydrolase domain-containing protein [Dactylosporangium sp. CA-233914]|uniref:serine hydrolase domain-containing protein n=1 Tax=Dactylosporangium sp. CA-233914 TaxID=3239934 RepID=UPI003D927CBF
MSVRTFIEAAQRRIDALHSMVLLRGGETVAAGAWHPYSLDRPHRLFSLSKSFTSTAVGFAVAEGLLDVDDPVAKHCDGRGDPRMLVRHLLTMTTGHVEDTIPIISQPQHTDWLEAFLALPVRKEPGTHFLYNTGATYAIGAIVQKLTGQRLVDYLRPRLFDPLDFGPVTWEQCPLGRDVAGWGMTARTPEIARFGHLYLHDERGILPAGWAQQATGKQVENAYAGENPDWREGYGFQFWRGRHGSFRGDGAFGQYCLVMPDRGEVLAITAGFTEMHLILDLVWEHLRDDETEPGPLPRLELPALHGGPSTVEGTFTVAAPRRTRPEDWRPSHERPPTIRSITFAAGRVVLEDETGTHEHPYADGTWTVTGDTAATGAWDGDTFTLRMAYVDGPFIRTYRCRFDGDELVIATNDNVSFGPTGYPPTRAVRQRL